MYRRIFFITSTTSQEVPSDKVIYNDNKTGLPIFFSIRTERIQENAIKEAIDKDLVYISWQTKTEVNTSHFELQRSTNGRDFYSIETIIASGDSQNCHRYGTTDSKYSFYYDRLYYRLKLVLKNGKEKFTDVITSDLNTVAVASVYDLTYARNQQ